MPIPRLPEIHQRRPATNRAFQVKKNSEAIADMKGHHEKSGHPIDLVVGWRFLGDRFDVHDFLLYLI